MRIKYILSVAIFSVGIAVSFFIVSDAIKVEAQTPPSGNARVASIQYPVPELGNCKSEIECRSYCDDSKNAEVCFAFAEKHNLMSQEEIQAAKKFVKVGKGPSGCTSRNECDNYCNNSAHINECIAFAEQNGLMSGKELGEAKKVQAAIARGVKPPACGGKSTCDQYCSEPNHIEECIIFGQAAGLMSEQEIQNSQKILVALKKGVKPPACGGKSTCDQYCGEPSNAEECIAFAEAAGFMKPEEVVMARKTGGKGPGGCNSKESCEAFCNNPTNQETCFNFGKENGMIPSGDLQRIDEGKKRFSNMLNQAPPEAITCISNAVGGDNLKKFKSGSAMPPRDIGDKIGECFRQGMSPGGPREEGNIPPAGQSSGNVKFQPGPGSANPGGQMMSQQSGPGGCKTPKECQSFCQSNPEACRNFRPEGNSGSGEPGQPMMPGVPGNVPNVNMPGFQEMQKFMQPGTGSIPQQFQEQIQQQFQEQIQQFQPGSFSPPPGGGMMPPPPSGSGFTPPPPPAGGSLFNIIKLFLGF